MWLKDPRGDKSRLTGNGLKMMVVTDHITWIPS